MWVWVEPRDGTPKGFLNLDTGDRIYCREERDKRHFGAVYVIYRNQTPFAWLDRQEDLVYAMNRLRQALNVINLFDREIAYL